MVPLLVIARQKRAAIFFLLLLLFSPSLAIPSSQSHIIKVLPYFGWYHALPYGFKPFYTVFQSPPNLVSQE